MNLDNNKKKTVKIKFKKKDGKMFKGTATVLIPVKKEVKYIYAYDPKIKRRCVFVVIKGNAISTISGYRFKFNKKIR